MENVKQKISILGATGSIGQSTLAVVSINPDYEVFALSANENIDLLFDQCMVFQPELAVVTKASNAEILAARLKASSSTTEVLWGSDALKQIASASEVDIVMAAIVGAAGLDSTLAAVESGKKCLLANKESLVMSGDLLLTSAAQSGAQIIPIDSEHNAIFQCLPKMGLESAACDISSVDKVILTASGGPFLHTQLSDFEDITPKQACNHPTWSMGQKISVDSATMMNKGLEYIEACLLFNLDSANLEVLIHPQSVIHSMVNFIDGSVLAQLGVADMRIPIANGLAYPQRIASGTKNLNLSEIGTLQFMEPDLIRFPCLKLGMEAAKVGGTVPTLLNAANEVAVAAFLAGRIKFTQISQLNEQVLSKIPCEAASSLAIIQDADSRARSIANKLILQNNC